jgi:nicotinamide riboside transporter PnuC
MINVSLVNKYKNDMASNIINQYLSLINALNYHSIAHRQNVAASMI